VSETNAKVRLATVWLDERLIELAQKIELVYSPLVDHKQFPEMVDVVIVEGAVSTDEDIVKIKKIRQHSKFLIALGDCAVTSNVPGMRNPFGVDSMMHRAYHENAETQRQDPSTDLPKLLERVRPVHEVVKVDLFVPGCPPPADAIWAVLTELLAGRTPDVAKLTRFGR
jgi:NAD-reducing hydrogenase small subunit